MREALDAIDVPAEVHIEHGLAPYTLAAVARRERARFLVVGARGLSRLSQVIFGSVSAQVIPEARCPVMVVPGPDD